MAMLQLTIASGAARRPAAPDLDDARVQIWHDKNGALFAYEYHLAGANWLYFPQVAYYRFQSAADGVIAFPEPAASTEIVWDMFYRVVLPVALQALGGEALHASAVVMQQGVVAFCADSETGKSTVAYGLRRRGYDLWADDAVAFEIVGQTIRAIPLPFLIRLRPASAAFFDVDTTVRQRLLHPDRVERRKTEPLPLVAVCVLRREPEIDSVAIDRLSLAEGFGAVIHHAYCFDLDDLGRKRLMMQRYLSLTARVPVFHVRFKPGLSQLPAMLDGIEQVIDQGAQLCASA